MPDLVRRAVATGTGEWDVQSFGLFDLMMFAALAALILALAAALVVVRCRDKRAERSMALRDEGYRSIVEDQMELVSRADSA